MGLTLDWTTDSRTFRTFLLVRQLDPGAIQARIRQARTEAGLTQQQLADLLERHKRTIENYERVRVPDFAELNKLARVLDRPVEWFLHGDLPRSTDADTDVLLRRFDGLEEMLVEMRTSMEISNVGFGATTTAVELLRRLRSGEQVPRDLVERVAVAIEETVRAYQDLADDLRATGASAQSAR